MKHVILVAALAVLPALPFAKTNEGPAQSTVRPPQKPVQVKQPLVDRVKSIPVQSAGGAVSANAAPADPAELGVINAAAADLTTRVPRFYTDVRPPARSGQVPRTRWQHMRGHEVWTRATLSALKRHGKPLVEMVPGDVDTWCQAYRTADDAGRRAFWVGFLSALAKYESTYKPWAVGGGGRWYGLLQILPGTARGYDCNVGTGEALKNGAANLSCAVRIMSTTVPRDGVIYGPGGRGVAADWGPMRSAAKRSEMARWLRRQNYCKPIDATRPKSRP